MKTIITILILTVVSLPCFANHSVEFGVFSALPREAKYVISQLQDKKVVTVNQAKYALGRINNHKVAVLISGIGIVDAAASTTEMINAFHPNYLIYTGTSGGVDPSLNIGDVILASRSILILTDDPLHSIPRYPSYPPSPVHTIANITEYPSAPLLLKKAEQIQQDFWLSAKNKDGQNVRAKIKTGLVASSANFPNPPEQVRDMRKMHVEVVDMETASMMKVCKIFNQTCFAVRSVSNVLTDRGDKTQNQKINDENFGLAADNAGKVVVQMIKNF